MAVAMVEDTSRAVACMNQRDIAQAQTVPGNRQLRIAANHCQTSVEVPVRRRSRAICGLVLIHNLFCRADCLGFARDRVYGRNK